MARLESYTGSIEVISGLKPKNGGSFALMDAHDVQVKEDGTRLDEALEELKSTIGSGGSGSGSCTITGDDSGNVVISSTNNAAIITDDGNGNVTVSNL